MVILIDGVYLFSDDEYEDKKRLKNPKLRCLLLHFFGLKIPLENVVTQLKSIFSENLQEYCVSNQEGSLDCYVKLKKKITEKEYSLLRLDSLQGFFVTPTASKVKNKKQCLKSLKKVNFLTNIPEKKSTKLYVEINSFSELDAVDAFLETLGTTPRPNVGLLVNYPAKSTLIDFKRKKYVKEMDKLDSSTEMLIYGQQIPNIGVQERIGSSDPFSEQLFNLEKILHTIKTENQDFFITNLDSFGVRVSNKMIPIERLKGLIDQFEQKMQSFLNQIFLKKVLQTGPATLITDGMFPIFLSQAGSGFRRMKKAKSIQLRIIYLLLYFSDFKLSEIKNLTKNNLLELIEKGDTDILLDSNSDPKNLSKTLLQIKNKLPGLGSYPMKGSDILSEKLKGMEGEINTLFDTYHFSVLGSNARLKSKTESVESKPLGEDKLLIKLISMDLKHTAVVLGFPGKFSSCSFRNKK